MSTVTPTENKKLMELVTIDEWVKQLSAIPEKEFTIPRVLEYTERKAIQPETLAPISENKKLMELVTIDEWVKQLSAIPEKEFTIPRVLEYTERKAIQPETLAP